MDYNFKTKEELYARVKPALHAKIEELKRINIQNISDEDIFNYLSIEKWSKANNLSLSDIVSDIIHLDPTVLDKHLKNNREKGVENEKEK